MRRYFQSSSEIDSQLEYNVDVPSMARQVNQRANSASRCLFLRYYSIVESPFVILSEGIVIRVYKLISSNYRWLLSLPILSDHFKFWESGKDPLTFAIFKC
jgi:hypothetical protein